MGGGGLPQGLGQGQSRREPSPITSSFVEESDLAKDLEAELQQVAQETDLAGSSSSSSEKKKSREDKLQRKTQTAEEES